MKQTQTKSLSFIVRCSSGPLPGETTPHVRSFWQSACATTNSRDDDVSRLTEQPQSRKRQRAQERAQEGKEKERDPTHVTNLSASAFTADSTTRRGRQTAEQALLLEEFNTNRALEDNKTLG